MYYVVLRSNTVGHSNNMLGLKVLLRNSENPETDVNLQEILDDWSINDQAYLCDYLLPVVSCDTEAVVLKLAGVVNLK